VKYLLTFLWVLVSFIPCRAQKIKPALHLIKGNTYYLTSSGSSTIVQSIDGQENKINLILSFRMAFKVIDITDSVYNMEVSYQTLDMKIQVADNTVDMDSQKNDKLDIPSSIAAAMMNKPFNIILTKSGKIKSVGNIEKMF
jgi:hypothetical protein